MAIEGPLRELGIHDVFQLLDLSRKTGRLRVTSALRDNEGTVSFRSGRVVAATIRSNPHPIGQILLHAGKITEAELEQARTIQQQPGERRRLADILVSSGALTPREVERQMRRQIEAVVFELMSWQEGFFSFVDGDVDESAADGSTGLSAESLLMEAARRIDEWTRIAQLVPNMAVTPALAEINADHAPMLDLRPNEWEVLSAIDGQTDLRAIAAAVGVSDFDVARIMYGLVSTGIVVLRASVPRNTGDSQRDDALILLSDAREALREGRGRDALAAAERALQVAPDLADGHVVAAYALDALERFNEVDAHLRRVAELQADVGGPFMALASRAVRRGQLARAIEYWERAIRAAPNSSEVERAREAMDHATRLNALVEVGSDS
jgi:tetratricopeptide (TPR) repeat protein